MRGNLALITGATSGIGLAIAEQLAKSGYDLLLIGRREERLKAISARCSEESKIEAGYVVLDIGDRAAVEKIFGTQNSLLERLAVVVNCAGLARGTEPMQTADLDHWDEMLDTNVKGLLYITRICLPHLIKNRVKVGTGHIVNIGSVAGRWTYPGGGVYCATKFAVRALSEGLRLDLMGTGIRVTNIEPGMVETEFSEVRFGGDKAKAKQVYQGMTALKPNDVAEAILWCLMRPTHVNIQELVIFPTDQAGVGFVHREKPREN